ncbi:hypothetical protein DV515_00005594 [Chloebia gouldiae]|uniref:Uncharacterized protein n=1 Tax=Chloebia gouldiae TaxID=44316 RepID=A0A3L8SN93_CHLGU|nr:hypothetical protein DV515_00005594 [Chloebia gouldiae]
MDFLLSQKKGEEEEDRDGERNGVNCPAGCSPRPERTGMSAWLLSLDDMAIMDPMDQQIKELRRLGLGRSSWDLFFLLIENGYNSNAPHLEKALFKRVSSSHHVGLAIETDSLPWQRSFQLCTLGDCVDLNENICFPFENGIDTDEDQDHEDISFLSFFLFPCDLDS